MQAESQQGDNFPSQQLGDFRSWGSTSTSLEELQQSFFRASLAEPVWQSFTLAFGCDWQDSSSLAIAESPTLTLASGRVGVRMTAGRALGGAQHPEPQAMVRGEEVQKVSTTQGVQCGLIESAKSSEQRGRETWGETRWTKRGVGTGAGGIKLPATQMLDSIINAG
jgi:hypothetical protein